MSSHSTSLSMFSTNITTIPDNQQMNSIFEEHRQPGTFLSSAKRSKTLGELSTKAVQYEMDSNDLQEAESNTPSRHTHAGREEATGQLEKAVTIGIVDHTKKRHSIGAVHFRTQITAPVCVTQPAAEPDVSRVSRGGLNAVREDKFAQGGLSPMFDSSGARSTRGSHVGGGVLAQNSGMLAQPSAGFSQSRGSHVGGGVFNQSSGMLPASGLMQQNSGMITAQPKRLALPAQQKKRRRKKQRGQSTHSRSTRT